MQKKVGVYTVLTCTLFPAHLKAVGEPPLMLGCSVMFAIHDAIIAARKDRIKGVSKFTVAQSLKKKTIQQLLKVIFQKILIFFCKFQEIKAVAEFSRGLKNLENPRKFKNATNSLENSLKFRKKKI